MKGMKICFTITVLLSLLAIISCSTTSPTAVKTDATYAGGYMKRVLVVGLANNMDHRQMFETYFADQLKSNGVEAFSATTVFSPDTVLNRDGVKKKAEELGAGHVFVTRFRGVETKVIDRPEMVSTLFAPKEMQYAYQEMKEVKLESTVYETKTEKVIWHMLSETLNPRSAQNAIDSFSKVAIKNLRSKNLIQ